MAPPSLPPLLTPNAPSPPKPNDWRKHLAGSLNLWLGLYLIAAIWALMDDTLVILAQQHCLSSLNAMFTIIAFLASLVLYGLMGLSPAIPKRIFLPLILLPWLGTALGLLVLIYDFQRIQVLDWWLSLGQISLVFAWAYGLRKPDNSRWFPIRVEHLGKRVFSVWNLVIFGLGNLLILLPVIAIYLAVCTSLAVGHFTAGFLSLRPSGLYAQARTYAREDNKTVMLFPMSHIADAGFYQMVSASATSNSVILMEGVTDTQNLLTNKLSYKRSADSLGLAEQHEELKMETGELVRADVDIEEFSQTTIDILNFVTYLHTQGINAENLRQLLDYHPTPGMEQRLFADLLLKRNAHLFKVLQERLPTAHEFIIPWGAAHMPGISQELLKAGFHQTSAHDYAVIRFGAKDKVAFKNIPAKTSNANTTAP